MSLDKYVEELKNQGEGVLNKKKEALKETAESDKKTINAYADDSLQSIRDGYNADVADVNESYEDAFRKNEVQVKLNERYLERKAAEMGLTDSGMNRTQMTANQLSYANQKGELTAQKQKAIDTLAAAMRAKITEVNTKRNDALAQVDSTLKKDIAQADMDFDKSIRETATAQYKAEQEAITAANKANAERINAAASSLNTLISHLYNEDLDERTKKSYIQSYINQHGVSEALYDVTRQYGYDIKKDAYSSLLRDYFLNSKISREEKINKYVDTYKLYGMADEEFLNVMDNVPSKFVDGITIQELNNVIKRVI